MESLSHALGTQLLPTVIPLVVLDIALARISPDLFVLATGTTILLKGVLAFLMREVRRSTATYQRDFSQYSATATWVVGMLRPAALHGIGDWASRRFAGASSALASAGVTMVRGNAAHNAAGVLTGGVAAAFVMILGGIEVLHARLTLSELATFFFAATLANTYLGAIVGAIPVILMGDLTLERLHRAASQSTDRTLTEREDASEPMLPGTLSLQDVVVEVAGRRLIGAVDVMVARSEIVAITAPNGFGKSSLLAVALGLLPPAAGRVDWEGRALTGEHARRFRQGIGIVPQQPWFFAGPITDNVLLGRSPRLPPSLETLAQPIRHRHADRGYAERLVQRAG